MKAAFFKHSLVVATASATVILVSGGIASAHIDPDPIAMQVGTTGTVTFNVEHGCDGSPTSDLKIQIPAGVTGVAPVDKEGWTATVTGDTVEFKGGPLDAATEDHFDITLTAPPTAGDVHFPIIQLCEAGEIDWLEIAAEGADEPEHPAPTLKITEGAPTAEDLTPEPETEEGTEGTAVATDTGAIPTTVAAASDDDSSNTGTIVVVVVIVVVVLVGGGVILARRQSSGPKT